MRKTYRSMLALVVLFNFGAYCQSGNMYVGSSNEALGKITKATETGTLVTTFNSTANYPYGMAIDLTNSKLYITSWSPDGILRCNLDGGSPVYYTPGIPASGPNEVAIDVPNNKMYVTSVDGSVYKMTLTGTSFTTLNNLTGDETTGIALDPVNSRLYVAFKAGNKILKEDFNGGSQQYITLSGLLSGPIGIALDLVHSKMFVVNSVNNHIIKSNLDGTGAVDLGNPGSLLNSPRDIALDINEGKMYITSFNSNTVVKASLDGTSAVSFTLGATLNQPWGIALDVINPLPVELVSFTAKEKSGNIYLRWNTATETNNYGFDIERRIVTAGKNSNDNSSEWAKVGFVRGNGNSSISKEYSFTDKTEVTAGRVVYRLVQIDNDGKTSESKEVELTLLPVNFEMEQNYPNPFNPSTTIKYSLPFAGKVSITVYDVLGNKVAEIVNQTKEAGRYNAEFNANGLASGIYIYKAEVNSIDGNKNYSSIKKMILMK